ncbi:MAG: CvpA family protein, partial [Campylobacter sp.]|nr:CvpA family protein [Campylobacter sp.]
MGLVVDFIIILIFAACVFNGYKKGLAKCLLKLLTSVLAIIVAIVLYKPIMNFVVDNTTIDDNIELSIEKTINQNKDENNSEIINEDSGLPDPVVKYVNTNLKESVDTQKDKAVKEVSSNAAKLIVAVGCIIIVYIISK